MRHFLLILLILFPLRAMAGTFIDGENALDHQDYQTALKLLLPLAKLGNVRAQYDVGLIYETGWDHTKPDYAQAMKWYRAAEDQGNTTARFAIGRLYDDGLGVPQDHTEAMKWYLKAAEPDIYRRAAHLGGADRLPDDRFQAYILVRKVIDENFSRYSGEPGQRTYDMYREILAKYERGLSPEQIAKAKNEVWLFDTPLKN